MTTLIQNEYEIIGLFAPISEKHPRHNCTHAPVLDSQKLKAFRQLMLNPNLSSSLKFQIAERFEDFVCHIEVQLSEEEKLEEILSRILPRIYNWEEANDQNNGVSIP